MREERTLRTKILECTVLVVCLFALAYYYHPLLVPMVLIGLGIRAWYGDRH